MQGGIPWRWAFIVMLALGLVSAAVTLAVARDSAAPAGRSPDWPGQVMIAVALFALPPAGRPGRLTATRRRA
jgi:hypothetical protein